MEMTKNDICKNYKEAKKKRAQITILAELNNTDEQTIKDILKEGGALGEKPGPKPKTVIEAADPVPGEVGYEEAVETEKPPLGIKPRDIAEKIFNESRIKEIIGAMNRYYEANMAIPAEWRTELKERL